MSNIPPEVRSKMSVYSEEEKADKTHTNFTKKKGRSYTQRLALRLQLTRLKRLAKK